MTTVTAPAILKIIDDVLAREGGYVDQAADRGRATNRGITQATLSEWRGTPVTVEDVKALTEAEAREIYLDRFITKPRLDAIVDPHVRALAVDCAVHHGPARAVEWLQQAAHVFVDGILGPQSEAAINRMTPRALYLRVLAERARFYGRLISRDHSQSVFAAGWAVRLAGFIESAP